MKIKTNKGNVGSTDDADNGKRNRLRIRTKDILKPKTPSCTNKQTREQRLREALNLVMNKTLSVTKAARQFEIPVSQLHDAICRQQYIEKE